MYSIKVFAIPLGLYFGMSGISIQLRSMLTRLCELHVS